MPKLYQLYKDLNDEDYGLDTLSMGMSDDYKIAIRMNIGDTWLREFQILPGRVHPQMNMVTSGGYVLTGIYLGRDAEIKRVKMIEDEKKGVNSNTTIHNKSQSIGSNDKGREREEGKSSKRQKRQ